VALRRKHKRSERSKIDATPPWEVRVREEVEPTTGPYDEADAPEDDLNRIDLGALRVPVVAGLDVRVELNEAQQVTAVTLAGVDGTMQLGVFAAPRNEGIWDEVRAEIAESMRAQRGGAKERDGAQFGTELTGTVPGERGAKVPVRFVGVDGPRWFLRAMLAGPAATEAARARRFEEALRNVVVVRGPAPLPVREPVPLTLPKEMAEQLAEGAAEPPPAD
jgi:hypothetical protein